MSSTSAACTLCRTSALSIRMDINRHDVLIITHSCDDLMDTRMRDHGHGGMGTILRDHQAQQQSLFRPTQRDISDRKQPSIMFRVSGIYGTFPSKDCRELVILPPPKIAFVRPHVPARRCQTLTTTRSRGFTIAAVTALTKATMPMRRAGKAKSTLPQSPAWPKRQLTSLWRLFNARP